MKIGIVVNSQTGNTFSVAQKLAEKLAACGHAVETVRLKPIGKVEAATKDYRFEVLPELAGYEAIVFASPVMAFSLSPAMVSYFSQIQGLAGKSVALLVTQGFPYAWMGGNRAIRTMALACESRGATVRGSGIVNWPRKSREEQIREVVDRLAMLLQGSGRD